MRNSRRYLLLKLLWKHVLHSTSILGWVEPMMHFFFTSYVHANLMHTYLFFSLFVLSCDCVSSLSLSLSWIDLVWQPNANLLRSGTLFVLGHLLLLILPFLLFIFGSMMKRPIRTSLRTSLNVAFIWSVMWFYQTFPTLFSQSYSHSGMGISWWDTFEVSYYVHIGVLFQHARYRYLCASVCHDIQRYTYRSYSKSYIWDTTCSKGITS